MSISSKSISSSSEDDHSGLRRGPWTLEEDDLLAKYIANHGEGRWNLLAKRSGLSRTGKSCRLRWLNYLKPDVKRGNLSSEEQLLIFELHSKWGNRWSKIAQHLPGRTDNEIKNYYRTRIQKQERYLKIDTDRTGSQETVRRLWMPRLLEKAKELSSLSATMSTQYQAIPLPLDSISQYSKIRTMPTQIPWHGLCMNEAEAAAAAAAGPNYSDLHEQNSDSEQNHSSCMSSSELANISKVHHQVLGYTTSQFHTSDYSDFGTYACDDGYHVNNNAYEMENFNLATTEVAADMEYTVGECQMADSNWVNNDFASSMWNMNELCKFRNFNK